MRNKGIDAAVLREIKNGIRFQRDLIRKLENHGILTAEHVLIKDKTVGNSLKRLKAAGEVVYLGQKVGWTHKENVQ